MPLRVRRSLQELEKQYPTDPEPLNKVVRAFAALQAKPSTDADSWFALAANHGAPLSADKAGNKPALTTWWGGYCAHGNVLFPMWHRAYCLRFEAAMRRVPGCEDVDLPFWDECLTMDQPAPKILTDKTFLLDGKHIPNPLYSYKFVAAISDDQSPVPGANPPKMDYRYSKPVGYETHRFPLSGLVGTQQYTNDSTIWNSQERFNTEVKRTAELNNNLKNWLKTGVVIDPPDKRTAQPGERDLKSVYGRFKTCLKTQSYTVFSNTTTERHIKVEKDGLPPANPNGLLVSLESPHNSIHLACGGFYQKGNYIANPDGFWEENRGANGDMGCNETAAFDPIFWLHHAFIDYVFWLWQRKWNKTAQGTLDIDMPGAHGTITGSDSQPGLPPSTPLTMKSPLNPFTKPGGSTPVTPNDLVDIEGQLGYKYGVGSLDAEVEADIPALFRGPLASVAEEQDLHKFMEVRNISEKHYRGSFVIRAYAVTPSGAEWEIGREAILGRWNTAGCGNCKSKDEAKAYVSVFKDLADILREGEQNSYDDIKYRVDITTSDPKLDFNGFDSLRTDIPFPPTIEDILPYLLEQAR